MHTAVPSAGNSDPEPLQIDIGIKEVAALTTEEKLQHFEDICTGDGTGRCRGSEDQQCGPGSDPVHQGQKDPPDT